ncbi:hydroxymethylbilane synthase [Natranaerobius thermophilus]|uniref:Porphobilinogen deaminase n=1 Tax=Natranaerobius thermophilus (strain ATCC BAA-1301 / DSM 18059 / JW/NM-WN-LF) TaxID=457570 RepID=HEM3_NATTJ|nr:hydroxymethylbilane synthase [Natranaerobius thermophilus]B2A1G7.1 RecName: Full=Porphobilinogen deaminase; Short=PBG; AltName: Full=Hydroxymethylbilane synthase; Short=HMBS; AltName: Full=Pre-uroporphyrinogen synthase [Natranaerobius thermophilus JW/NM-WN-LF]ACB84707.1 porphobilinogen deaminase [Natranaerobius thermophilus JW/NM-WN-LF]
MKLRIGTRRSQLALDQTNWVVEQLKTHYPDIEIEIKKIETKGDQLLNVSLSKVGGKGLFLKEIQNALLQGEIDLAVHSMKDIPTETTEDLEICAITKRVDPLDALISNNDITIDELPENAKIGTSSLRRGSQLKAYRNDLQIIPIRGNINTRMNKLQELPELDAVVLAKAGLVRSGMTDSISQNISPEIIVPCPGQGALGLEIRHDNENLKEKLAVLDDSESRKAIGAERAFLNRLGGSCHVPVGAYAEIISNELHLTGVVASEDGQDVIKRSVQTHLSDNNKIPSTLGNDLAEELIELGANKILSELKEG